MTTEPHISLRVDGATAILTIANSRRRNAFTYRMLKEIPTLLQRLDADTAIRVIVLEGEGDQAFAAGDDISEFAEHRSTPQDERAYMAAAMAAFEAPAACGKPTIAAIGGVCMGGAMHLAAACDLRICGQSARFAVPAARLGVGYPLQGVSRFVALLGAANSSTLLMSARVLPAAEMYRMGFASELVDDERVKPTAYERAAELCGHAPLSLAAIKLAIAACRGTDAAGAEAAAAVIGRCASSSDFIEGRRAFLEKRPARFIGA